MYLLMKRIVDLTASMVLLGLLVAPILIVFLMLKISSKDSVIYYSDRIGKNNLIFKIPKFKIIKSDVPKVAIHQCKR